MLIDNLKKFTWYLIRIVGFSDQGPSASSEVIRVRTLEDGMFERIHLPNCIEINNT